MDELDFSEDGIDNIDTELFSRFTRQHILYWINMMRLHKVGESPLKCFVLLSNRNLYGYRSLQGQRFNSRRGKGFE